MSETAVPRRLATIVALDVAGYSARTEADEEKSTAEVAGLRGVIEAIAKAHAGRIFNTAGDGFMLEFGSSVSAVEAACELAERCEPKVRVGVHVGDVVVQPNGDLLGHGVNVAARLMAQAQPGGALVSADVKRMIRGPVIERLVARGPIRLDKMTETIEAFALVAMACATVTPQSKSTEPLLAVLPFDNLSNDPEMQFFSDGVSEEILQIVSRVQGLKVIGRSSSFQFRGRDKSLPNVSRVLKASHVLDGAVRRSGNRIRVSVALMEGAGQTTLWTQSYEGNLADTFELQDNIAAAIADALKTALPNAARSSEIGITPEDIDLYLKARAHIRNWAVDKLDDAVSSLHQLVARLPTFARAWETLAVARVQQRWTATPDEDVHLLEDGRAAARRAIMLNSAAGEAYAAVCNFDAGTLNWAELVALAERGLRADPNCSLLWVTLGQIHRCVGRFRESRSSWARAFELDPLAVHTRRSHAFVCFETGDVAEGAAIYDALLDEQHPNLALAWEAWVGQWFYGTPASQKLAFEKCERHRATIDREHLSIWTMLVEHKANPETHDLDRVVAARERAAVDEPHLAVGYGLMLIEVGALDKGLALVERCLNGTAPLEIWFGLKFQMNNQPDTMLFFYPQYANQFRRNPRFVRVCAKFGLVDYWRTSGHWPDCVEEVSPYYDFKAECEKVATQKP